MCRLIFFLPTRPRLAPRAVSSKPPLRTTEKRILSVTTIFYSSPCTSPSCSRKPSVFRPLSSSLKTLSMLQVRLLATSATATTKRERATARTRVRRVTTRAMTTREPTALDPPLVTSVCAMLTLTTMKRSPRRAKSAVVETEGRTERTARMSSKQSPRSQLPK